ARKGSISFPLRSRAGSVFRAHYPGGGSGHARGIPSLHCPRMRMHTEFVTGRIHHRKGCTRHFTNKGYSMLSYKIADFTQTLRFDELPPQTVRMTRLAF